MAAPSWIPFVWHTSLFVARKFIIEFGSSASKIFIFVWPCSFLAQLAKSFSDTILEPRWFIGEAVGSVLQFVAKSGVHQAQSLGPIVVQPAILQIVVVQKVRIGLSVPRWLAKLNRHTRRWQLFFETRWRWWRKRERVWRFERRVSDLLDFPPSPFFDGERQCAKSVRLCSDTELWRGLFYCLVEYECVYSFSHFNSNAFRKIASQICIRRTLQSAPWRSWLNVVFLQFCCKQRPIWNKYRCALETFAKYVPA